MKNRDAFARITIAGTLCLILSNPNVFSQTRDPQRDEDIPRPNSAPNEPGVQGPQRGLDQERGGKKGGRGRNRPGGGQGSGKRGGGLRSEQRRAVAAVMPAEVAALGPLYPLLGCPTDHSITLNLRPAETLEGYIEYGVESGRYSDRTETSPFPAEKPSEIALNELEPDTQYFYRIRWRKPGDEPFDTGPENRFHTRRAPGSPFTFEIMGDSHPERPHQFDPSLYVRTLSAAASDRPDFYMTIGDDFSVDKLPVADSSTVDAVYWNQRQYLSLVGGSSPIFLVNGNHEQAAAYNLDGGPDNVAVWAQTSRNKYFPQPAPDQDFYTGDAEPVEHIGLLRDYYAWTWGDALFVVIDPYWHSSVPVDSVYGGGNKSRDMWAITLGDQQYKWLARTLAESEAAYKFVFAHHVLGTGRGGIECAGGYEWGGRDRRGEWLFDKKRPGWDAPIHRLMADNGFTIFFQGHDHIFVRQELDGVVYQTLPEPADPNYALYNQDAYRTGDAFPNSGRVRVAVSPAKVSVEYVRSYLPADETAEHPDGEIAFRYEIPPVAAAVKSSKTD